MKREKFLSITLILAVVMAGVSTVFADTWTTYNNNNTGGAVGNNTVNSAAVDSGSVKWFGTNGGGLAKYDGTTWTKYGTAQGLAGNTATHADFDSSGNKWVTTSTGLSKYAGSSWTKYTTGNSGLAGNNCLTVATQSTTIWIGTYANGVSKYDGTTWTTYTSANSGLANNRVLDAVVDGSGNKWFATLTGANKYDGTTWAKYTTANSGLANNSVKAVAVAPNGDIWFGTAGGVNKFNGSSWTTYTITQGLGENDTSAIDVASDGTVWAGHTGSGVSKFAGSTPWTVYTTSNGLANNNVNGIDTEGTTVVWFATGGGGVSKLEIVAVNPPVANFSGSPTSGNVPLTVNFTDSSTNTPTSWSWTFGDSGTSTAQNPSHQYTSVGTYTVALTASNAGGSDIETKTNYIVVTSIPAPVANFSGSPTSGNVPLTVNFTDSTNGPVTAWSWTFGDSGTSNSQNPSHQYTSAGTYTVSLTATGPGGSNTNTKTNYITVTTLPPAPNFSGTPMSGFAPLTVIFTDLSTGPIDTWKWVFGDGNTLNYSNPPSTIENTYISAGTYTVQLSVRDENTTQYYTETKTNYITVNQSTTPAAEFSGSPTSGSFPLTVNFTDLSGGNVNAWSWNFGDGGTSTAKNPSHIYQYVGSYTVSLTASGPSGTDTETKTNYIVVITPSGPTAAFSGSPTGGNKPLTVNFTDSSTGNIAAWSWNFGDSGTSAQQNPSHTYQSAGYYTVSLTVSSSYGSDIETKINYISVGENPPNAAFTASPTSGNYPLAVNFTDLSSGSVTSWSWTFGDGGTSTAENPSHQYNSAGNYAVSQTVSGPYGSDIETKTNYISVYTPVPVAAFTGSPTSGGCPLAATFTDQSTGSVTSWSWNFGDSGTANVRNPVHIYQTEGSYTVSLTVNGPNGSDIETKTNYITVTAPQYEELWTTYNNSNTGGAINNAINGAAVETGGVRWFATNGGGLAKYDGTTWIKYTTSLGLANNTVYAIAFDSSGNKWIATIGGVNKYTGTSWTKYTSGNSALANNNTRCIAVDNSGDVWVGTYASGICKFNGTSWTKYTTANSGLAGNGVRGVAVDSSNNKWIATGGGVSMYDGTTWTKYVKPPLASLDTRAVAVAPNGNKWVATLSGVNRLIGTSWVTYTTSDGLAKNDTQSIAVDAGGIVWAGSNGSGLSKFAGAAPWTVFNTTNSGLVNNTVNVVTTESAVMIWLGAGSNVNQIRLVAGPSAAFTGSPTSGDAPLTVNFADASAGEITGWSWNFGDSGTSTAQNPSHNYQTPGTFSVSLTVSGPGGSNTSTRTNYISVIAPAPGQASNPSPANGATNISNTADLSWTAGLYATSHDVYFGTNPTPSQYKGNQAGVTFDPGTLSYNTTYYWRIDAKNVSGTNTGVVWSFTTTPPPPGQAGNPAPADGAANVDSTADLSWSAGANATSRDIYFGTSSPGAFRGNQAGTTFDPGTLQTATTYYWRIDEKGSGGTTTGVVWSFTTAPPLPGQAAIPVPANGATNVSRMTDLQWAAGSYAASHDVYFGTTPSLGAGEFKGNQTGTIFDPGTLNYVTTYYWRIDEKNYTGTTTGEVWSFTVKAMTAPAQAVAPHPVNGATNVNVNTHLHWTAGEDAASHDVYFGTSSSLGSGQFKGNQTTTMFDPSTLADLTTYYWRIDEKNVLGTTTGQVWSFTTGRRWAPGPTGYIVGWGADGEGEVSNKPSGNDFVAVRAGHSHSLALRSDGTVAAWGKDSYGSGSVPPALTGRTVVDISTGYAHNFVLFDDGTVFNWGASDKPGPSWREMWPVPEELNGQVIVAIAAGGDHDVVLKDDGSLFCWGYDSQGQVSETPSGNDYVAVAAGNYHSLALKADGTVVAWGYDNYNQCKIPPQAHGAIAIEAGSYCSMALKADGTIVVWGLNGFVPSPNANFVGMGAGGYSKIALRSDGTIVSWRAGDSSPEPTTPTDAGYIAVAGGYYHWLAIKSLSTLPGQAINPTPASGQTNTNALGLNLKWMPGLNATSHKVYFGTNPTPGAGEYKGEQTGTTFNPGTLNYLTTYYWRIDEKNAVDTTTGVVWSFTTKPTPQIPGQASNPAPASSATNINITADLSWTAGSYAASHDVYFGTNPSPGTAEFKGNRAVNTFDPGVMSYGKTYYWRIDEKNEVGTTTGTVWNFATKAGPLNGLVSLWKLDDLYGSTATDSSDNGHNGTLAGGVNWAPTSGILGGAASFDASADGRVSVPTTGMTASAGTIAMWVKLAEPQSELGKDGYRFLFGCTPDRIQLYMNDYDTQLDLGLGSDHLKHANIANLTTETWYHIALTWSGATYFVYVDGVARATGTYSGLNNIASQAAIGNNGVAQNQGFNGLIDDVGVWNRALAAGEISDLFNEPTVEIAGDPSPPDGSTYISTDADISWAAGKYAISHNVYFGTNPVPGTAEFKDNQTGKIFDPGALTEGTTYYWRVDEVNNTTTWTGDIWRFTTQAPVPPQQAGSPSPANSATAVDVYANLLWTAGAGSTSHDVYFGTNPTPGSAEFKGNLTANTFEPGHLSEQTTYYWRIDEKNSYGTTTGAIWSFTTGTKPPPVLVSQWKFDETSGTTAADSSGNGHNGTLAGTVAWSPTGGTQNGAVNFDGSNNDGRVQIPTSGMNALQGTITMWVKLAEPQYTLGRNGYKFIFGCGAHPNRIQLYMDNYDTFLDLGLGDSLLRKQDIVTLNTETWCHLALAWDGSSYVVYVDGVEKAAGTYAGLTALSTTAHIGNTGTETTQAFNGLIDNVTIWNDALNTAEIANVYIAGAPLQDIATNPNPANGRQTVNTTVTLSWWPGRYASLHDVYFGTNPTPGAGELKGRQSVTTFNPATLNLGTIYYWRIDSVNDTNIWQGSVWNFTTYSGPPQQATNPSPANSASGAPATAKLGWTAGSNTTSFNVYFGANPTPGSAEFKGNQAEATYDPGSLNYQTTYYWRIDAVGPGGTTTGAVWSFTTTVEAPAFPEAEGSGRWTIGGRGGQIIEVTNLNDSGPGSLRDAVAASGPRIVVFRVSGTIQLLARIRITNPYITIAGQTAPGDGICIRDYPLEIEASEVIVRHIRVRVGDEGAGATEGPDTINVRAGVGIMLDHISASWSIDETLSIAEGSTRGPLDNVTVQWCIVSESLHCSVHVKGCHGYGSLIHGALGSQYSFHHNLYAHHQDRVPRPGVNTDRNHISDPLGWTLDWRNNVIYQGKGYNSDGDGLSKYNFIANYYTRTGETPYREQCPYSRAYFNDNWHNGILPSDPWSIVSGCSGSCRQSSPFPVAPVETQDAPTAYTLVLADAGATLPDRDAVDERIVNQVITGTGDLIDSQSQVGGWPLLQSTTPPIDTDHDGMPDSWESARGLNPNNAGDAALDRNADGYTNIEEYINGIPWP